MPSALETRDGVRVLGRRRGRVIWGGQSDGRLLRRRHIDLSEALAWRRDRRTDGEQGWLVSEQGRLQPTLQWILPSGSYVGFASLDGDSLGQLRQTFHRNPSVSQEWGTVVDPCALFCKLRVP